MTDGRRVDWCAEIGSDVTVARLASDMGGGLLRLGPDWIKKKPAWLKTPRSSTTPAYASTDHPEISGCPSFRHPTKCNHLREPTAD